jgi:hypothetical protein
MPRDRRPGAETFGEEVTPGYWAPFRDHRGRAMIAAAPRSHDSRPEERRVLLQHHRRSKTLFCKIAGSGRIGHGPVQFAAADPGRCDRSVSGPPWTVDSPDQEEQASRPGRCMRSGDRSDHRTGLPGAWITAATSPRCAPQPGQPGQGGPLGVGNHHTVQRVEQHDRRGHWFQSQYRPPGQTVPLRQHSRFRVSG